MRKWGNPAASEVFGCQQQMSAMAHFIKRREFIGSLLGEIESSVEPSDLNAASRARTCLVSPSLARHHSLSSPRWLPPLASCFTKKIDVTRDRPQAATRTCAHVFTVPPWATEGHSVLLPKGSAPSPGHDGHSQLHPEGFGSSRPALCLLAPFIQFRPNPPRPCT